MTNISARHIFALMAKILLIEDDKTQADIYLTRILAEGYGAAWANDGELGLRMALENKPNVIVLDVRMPKMDGTSVLEELRKDQWGANVPVIILTNLDPTNELTDKIYKNRASYFLLKQATEPELLIEKIREILAKPTQTTSY